MFNNLKLIKEVLKDVIEELSNYFILFFIFIEKIFIKLVIFCVVIIVSILIGIIPMYIYAPNLFSFLINYIGFDFSDISLHEKITSQQESINNLEKSINDIKIELEKKNVQLSIVKGQKDGILEGVKQIQIEHTNWWNIILTISGVTIIGGGALYLFFSGSDGDFFRPILNSFSENNNIINTLITKTSEQVNNNLLKTSSKIDYINETVVSINNSLLSLVKDIDDFLKKNGK